MCGRSRLSRRMQIIAAHQETKMPRTIVSDVGALCYRRLLSCLLRLELRPSRSLRRCDPCTSRCRELSPHTSTNGFSCNST